MAPCVRRLPQAVSADTGLLCDKAALLGETKKKGTCWNVIVEVLKDRLLLSLASGSLLVSNLERLVY